MADTYILIDRVPVAANDVEWVMWRYNNREQCVVKQTQTDHGVFVSTVFMGLDHNFGDHDPLLFETMIFGGPKNGNCYRCSTWEQAERIHDEVLAEVLAAASLEEGSA